MEQKQSRPKSKYKIIKTLSEDTCIIESLEDPVAVKVVSFDELESGPIHWDAREINRQMAMMDKKADSERGQKVSQMNKGKR